MTEIREIPGFPGYGVSADGRAWTHKSPYGIWRELKQNLSGGHSRRRNCVALYLNGKKHTKYVGTLVLEAFVGPRPEGARVEHINRGWLDCRLENLRWCSREKYPKPICEKRKFSPHAVRNIRYLLEQKCLHKDIARQYGVSRTAITDIHRGRTYKDVK